MVFNILKTIHIFSVIAWMAGLLYLPRIFVYHSEAKHEEGPRPAVEQSHSLSKTTEISPPTDSTASQLLGNDDGILVRSVRQNRA